MAGGGNILIGQLGLDITQLKGQIDSVNKLLNSIGKDSKANVESLSNTYSELAKNIAKVGQADTEANSKSKLAELTAAYRQLTMAQNEYLRAYKSGDSGQQSNWSNHLNNIRNVIDAEKQRLNAMQLTETELNKYSILVDRISTAESVFQTKADKSNDILKRAQTEYKNLTSAQKGYMDAMNRGDQSSMQFWQARIDQSGIVIANLEEEANTLDHNSAQYQNITKIIQQMRDAQGQFGQKIQQSTDLAANMSQQFSKLFSIVKMIAGVSLVKIWHDALNYAKEYDKALTDIAIVTQKPIENVRAMGDEYRKIADELGVTSTSIAQAASAVYRQGYTSNTEVSGILRGITKFGAVSDLSTDQALSTMTASMQNFKKETESAQQTVERIGDTWSYMGDSVATNSTEIAEAMSKASASVKSVGLEFERASAYAAILLAKTQQSGQVIGTQLNSLASRYGKVTSTGYKKITSDDEGEALSFNDISKSLQTAGIKMYDIATKTFLPLGDVLDSLAEKWVALEADQRNYIATSMAGTRGMNYFLTLMENYNEAMNLESGAGQNRGIMNDKYETWLKGVEAAQNNFKNSVESLYSVLKSDTLVSFYNGMANIVDVFTAGTNAVNGFNLKIPLVASGIMLVVAAVMKLKTIIGEIASAGSAIKTLSVLTSPGGFGIAIAGIATVLSAFGAAISYFSTASERAMEAATKNVEKYNQQISEKSIKADGIKTIADELDALAEKTNLSAEETERFRELCTLLANESDFVGAKYGQQAEGLTSIGDAASVAREEVQKLMAEIDATARLALPSAMDVYNSKLSGLYGEDDFSFERYKDFWTSINPDASIDVLLRGYAERLSKVSELAGKKSLETYISDLDQFINLERGDRFFMGISDDTMSIVEETYDHLIALMTIKNSEIDGLSSDLQNILSGLFANSDYSELFLENKGLRDRITNAMLGVDWGETNAEDIKSYVESFMATIMNTFDDIDLVQFFDGENPLGKLLLQSMINGEIPESDVQAETQKALDMFSGMAMDEVGGYLMSNDFDGLFAPESSFIVAVAEQMYSAMEEALNSLEMMDNTDLQERFAEAVANGLFSKGKLDIFNNSIDNALANVSPEEFQRVREALIEAMFTMGETELQEFVVKLIPTLDVDTSEIDAKTFRDQVQAELDAIELMRDENGGAYVSEADEKRAEYLRGLLEQIDVLMADIASKSVFGEDMSTDMFQNSLDKLNALAEAYADISFGEFDGDFKSLLEDVPELVGMIGDQDTTLESIQLIFTELYDSIKETADALGIALPELQDYNAALSAAFDPTADLTSAFKKLNAGEKLGAELVTSLGKAYPSLQKALKDYEKGTISAEKMANKLNKALSDKAAIEFSKDLKSAVKNVDEAKKGTADYEEAMMALGDLFTGNQWSNLDSLEFATSQLDNIRAACNGDIEAFQALQEAAFVNIVGTANVDFSAMTNGLALVGDNAVQVGNLLASLGMGQVETKVLHGNADVLRQTDTGFEIVNVPVNGQVQIWKPSSGNPFAKGISGGSGGGGGGGGGGGSTSVSKSTQKMLDDMEKKNDAYDNRLKLNNLRKEYHDIRGEIQGVIEYTKNESDIIKDQNKTLEENIAKLEAEIKANEEIMAKKRSSSRAYKQAETDLEALNKAHKEYTETLLENKNRLEEIIKEIEDFKEQARQTVISVQDLIRDTIQAQADLKRDMLDGTVSLEDEILEVIRTRYEEEQELAVETANKKIEAIQDEIDAIDELIDERRKLIDKEDQEDEIAELEAKIARISADPTRRKELLQLQDELAKKRKELAWDTYEDEMNAQKDSLEGQITNLEDYIEYVNDYYDELFNNPYKLIEEMKGIMSMTDEEIIKWLMVNHNEYSKYTEAKQEQMRAAWQETINQMRGITETYNKEVEAVMQMTDEEIIAWLKKYNIDFQNATKEQQESFIKSWQDTLDAWRNAYKEVAADVSSTSYTPTSSGGSSGGGGGGGSSGGGPTSKPKVQYTGTAEYQYRVKDGSWKKMTQINASYVSKEDAINIAKSKGKAAAQKLVTYEGPGTTVRLIKAYKEGGLAYSTGLAWLDGTKSKPERVLSSYQTQLFEDLIQTLHEIKTINVGGIMSSKAPDVSNASGGFTIEQIQVNVERLETDADYEEMANRVGEKLKEKITKGMAIGGIII